MESNWWGRKKAGGVPSRPILRTMILNGTALLLLAVFPAACTRQVARKGLEPRHFSVDWNAVDAQTLELDGYTVEGIVLTPTQWPLEASLKKLAEGDFIGVIDHFDLRFHSSRLDNDVLERLFEKGFLPAYLRVRNTGANAIPLPQQLHLRADEDKMFYPIPPEDLPAFFQEIDWEEFGRVVLVTALIVLVIVASAKNNRGGGSIYISNPRIGGYQGDKSQGVPPQDRGLLRRMMLPPGEEREGLIFFRIHGTVADWTTARIAMDSSGQ